MLLLEEHKRLKCRETSRLKCLLLKAISEQQKKRGKKKKTEDTYLHQREPR
jgi:hypothetical protein